MNGFIKRSMWLSILLFCFVELTQSAQAASFDCAKAGAKVEQIICDNPDISMLDDELDIAYKAAVKGSQQVEIIKQAQKQWLRERNDCIDANCLKLAYKSRLVSLGFPHAPQKAVSGTSVSLTQANLDLQAKPKEADKSELVRRILSRVKINHFAEAFCEEFISDLRRMENIEFIEPIERSEKFDDPIWDSYKAQCPDTWLFEKFSCEPRAAMYLDELPQEERYVEMKISCRQYQCTENFKHFRIHLNGDEGNRTEDIFYCERAHGPLNRQGMAPYDTSGGYAVVDLKKCQRAAGVNSHDPYSYSYHYPLENINGLVVYKGKHLIFDLREIDEKAHMPEKTSYELEVWGYDRRNSEKRTRLYTSCLFTTAN